MNKERANKKYEMRPRKALMFKKCILITLFFQNVFLTLVRSLSSYNSSLKPVFSIWLFFRAALHQAQQIRLDVIEKLVHLLSLSC